MSLMPIDTSNGVAISSYLEKARDWLSRAVDETGPEQIAAAKAEIATAAEATKQLGLSKEIQLDAREMVRRAEYALGKAIRKGQAEGTIAKRGDIGGTPPRASSRGALQKDFSSIKDFASSAELYGNSTKGQFGILDLAASNPDDFDAAIDAAKAEGNLSRANVARKIAGDSQSRRRPLTDAAKDAGWDLRKAVERVSALLDDDRFEQNKEQVAPHLRSHLADAIQACQSLINRIN